MATILDSSFLYTEEYLRAPTPYWSRLRHDAPLLFDEQGEFWLLSRYHDVVSVLLDFETYSTLPYRRIFRPVIGPTFVEMDGQDHDSRRAIVAPALVGNALGSYRPLVEQSVAKIAATLPAGSSCDLRAAFTSRLPLLVIAELLGLAEEDHELFYGHCAEILHGLEGLEPALSRGIASHQELAAHFRPLVDERRSCPKSDLISRIAGSEIDGERLTATEIESVISLLLTAGGETTDMAIANLWWGLLTEPDALAAVRDDQALLDNAFSESMRRDGAVVYEDRETTRPVEWYGQEIPGGSIVRVCLGAANHDETVFTDPESFVIDRDDLRLGKEQRGAGGADGRAGHLTFGAGKHFCLGYQLARLEAVVSTEHFLDRLSSSTLDPDVDCAPRINFFHRRPEALVVRALDD